MRLTSLAKRRSSDSLLEHRKECSFEFGPQTIQVETFDRNTDQQTNRRLTWPLLSQFEVKRENNRKKYIKKGNKKTFFDSHWPFAAKSIFFERETSKNSEDVCVGSGIMDADQVNFELQNAQQTPKLPFSLLVTGMIFSFCLLSLLLPRLDDF